ncbi:hypothetical protein [Xylocopilactobacillus apicola]|uniref:Uncharacterized protein n=1 Tax=Xylocopilactobacillus apicola TaxID=2932184 RepID=A0AAU9CV42_9LACO|nr:hypothetical protein [Xylocopilactobacillus apicola]BDR57862.1 hypothetical protein XA3_03030 [Xylocopilactobacillus apicola]
MKLKKIWKIVLAICLAVSVLVIWLWHESGMKKLPNSVDVQQVSDADAKKEIEEYKKKGYKVEEKNGRVKVTPPNE